MGELKTTVTDYGNGIFAIDQEMVRAFLIVGRDKALLLDTGAVRIPIRSTIRQMTALPVTVILTHGDGDHIENLPDFPDAWMHRNDMDTVLSHASCKHVRLHPIDEGELFDIGGRKLTVLFTPGHTAGSISLLDEDHKLLFAGDTVSYGPVFMFGAKRNMLTYRNTLQRLIAMKDHGIFATVYCCHNTCPVAADTVNDLIACVDGILDQSIPGIPAPMPVPTGDKPQLGKFGNCMVLF